MYRATARQEEFPHSAPSNDGAALDDATPLMRVDRPLWIRTDLPYKEAKRLLVDPFERAYLHDLLSRHPNNISAASREAGISRRYLRQLIAKHGLPPQLDHGANAG